MAKQPAPISLRLPPALLEQFDSYCKARRRKRGEMLRMLVEDAVAIPTAPPAPPESRPQ